MFWPEVFLLLAIFLLNFDMENMIPINMKQCFYWGKILAKFWKIRKICNIPIFSEIFGFYQVLENKMKFPAHSDSDFSLVAFFN
jgi:hypothetical protein